MTQYLKYSTYQSIDNIFKDWYQSEDKILKCAQKLTFILTKLFPLGERERELSKKEMEGGRKKDLL